MRYNDERPAGHDRQSVPSSVPRNRWHGAHRRHPLDVVAKNTLLSDTQRHAAGHPGRTHDIFEGTEQIQQLVISRAISGLRIE